MKRKREQDDIRKPDHPYSKAHRRSPEDSPGRMEKEQPTDTEELLLILINHLRGLLESAQIRPAEEPK
ncbi:unnamed protein product [Ilex paraguariensis]|uniref:Uncharacterized protein n=1 Tax=Ilex paraguariensis TaxID=185542 RepID=A0ABC8UJ03_9AQUA